MKTIKTAYAAPIRVEFWYNSKSKRAVPSEHDVKRVESLIRQGYVEGELNTLVHVGNRDYEFIGWWKILKD